MAKRNVAIARILADYKDITKNPLEGIYVEFKDENDPFVWTIFMEGPTETYFEGGVFKLEMTFPETYPSNPPQLKFLSEFFHPNVYDEKDDVGKVCISILHPPGDDPMSGETASERWCPTQNVSTILLSVQSLFSEPNMFSPASTTAMKMLRDHPEQYKVKVKQLCEKSRREFPPGIKIPHPDSDFSERQKQIQQNKGMDLSMSMGMDDFYDDFDDESGEVIIYSDEE